MSEQKTPGTAPGMEGIKPPVEGEAPVPPKVEPPAEEPAAPVVVEIDAVTADQGTLSEAPKNLRKARERLSECVERNGGLSGERGEIELRFLVQARGRAEGVSVKRKRNVTDVAAKCVADVVDRRYVGLPEAPVVGASLVVTISKKKK